MEPSPDNRVGLPDKCRHLWGPCDGYSTEHLEREVEK